MTNEGKTYGAASGAQDLYIVEARTSYISPEVHCGMILDGQWRRVYFPESPIGIKTLTYSRIADELQLLNYEAALARATWFMSEPSSGELPFHALCVQTRIVKVKLTYSYSTEEVGVGEMLSAAEMWRSAKFTKREA
jgi:hypothetical protein